MNPELLRSENTREGKEEYWRQVEAGLDDVGDNLGYRMDEGIKKAVVALNVIGLPPSASCEGHSNRGAVHPWVDVEEPNKPERYEGESFTDMKKRIAKKYGISLDELHRGIDIGAKREVDGWLEGREKTEEWKKWRGKNKELQRLAESLLEEFYKGRNVSNDVRIGIKKSGHDTFRLQNGARIFLGEKEYGIKKTRESKLAEDLTQEERKRLGQILPELQAEMDAFADFIKEKYLNDENI